MLLLNNKQVDYFYFSGGEIQVQLPETIKEERVILTWKPVKASDILLLMLTVNALQEAGIDDIDLDILYLPYARQDRVCSFGQAFSLKVMCNILNMINVNTIRLYDVHNTYKMNLLMDGRSLWHIDPCDIFIRHRMLKYFDLSNLILCAPDKGAYKKVKEIVSYFTLLEFVSLKKIREPSNGYISKIFLNELSPSPKGFNILIVDDICDGGATFIMAAEELKKHGAEDLYLYVTHGIFSNGLEELSKYFKHIYCHHVLDEAKFKNDKRLTILRRLLNDSQPAVCY